MSTPTLMLVWPRGAMPTLEDVLRHGGGQWFDLGAACDASTAGIHVILDRSGGVQWRHKGAARCCIHAISRTLLALAHPEKDNRLLQPLPFPGQVKLHRLWTLHEIGTSPCDVELEYRDGELYFTNAGLDGWHPLKPAWGRGMALTHA